MNSRHPDLHRNARARAGAELPHSPCTTEGFIACLDSPTLGHRHPTVHPSTTCTQPKEQTFRPARSLGWSLSTVGHPPIRIHPRAGTLPLLARRPIGSVLNRRCLSRWALSYYARTQGAGCSCSADGSEFSRELILAQVPNPINNPRTARMRSHSRLTDLKANDVPIKLRTVLLTLNLIH